MAINYFIRPSVEVTVTRHSATYENKPVGVMHITSIGKKTGSDGLFELHFSGNPTTWYYSVEANRDTDYDTIAALISPLTTVSDMRTFFNGTFKETFNALVSSDGVTVTMSLEQSGGGDLTMQLSTGDVVLDCTPAATIALTAGTDSSPQDNFIYVLESTGVLTKSTTAWPTAEHIKVAYFLVPSAGFVQTNGCYINQNWNDHLADTTDMGHMAHIAEKCRRLGSSYFSGVDPNGTTSYLTISGTTVDFKCTTGVIFQMHAQDFTAIDTSTGDVVLVRNWFGDAWHDITNLYDIVADSTGTTIGNNRYFNITAIGVMNKTAQYSPVFINLPSGTYTTQADAENDVDGYDDFTIPREFGLESSTGFLIARITVQKNTSTWTWMSTKDLRGKSPDTASGSGVNDHGGLGGLADDDHTQYLLADGTRAMSGALDMGTNAITNVGNVDGRDVSADGTQLDTNTSKLAGIEAGATADQSDAEIETAYNNQVSVVSQAEAEAGTSTTVRRWTAQRVAQAIAALETGGSSSALYAVKTTDQAYTTVADVITWGSATTDAAFSFNASTGVVTVNTTGRYKISADFSVAQTSGTQDVTSSVELQVDTGGGYAVQAGSNRNTYTSGNNQGGTMTINMILSLTATNTFKFRITRTSGTQTIAIEDATLNVYSV